MRSFLINSTVVISALCLTGCGGGGGDSLSTPQPSVAPPPPPSYVTKDYTITMSEAAVHRISNGDAVEVDISDISASGTVVVTQ
jgi:hypothetical protein